MNFHLFKRLEISDLARSMLGEAWSDKRKKEVEDEMVRRGLALVDHRVLSDYDLALWRGTGGLLAGVYTVSINNGQYDPGDYFTQKFGRSYKPDAPALRSKNAEILKILHEWATKYGKIFVSSVDADKLKAYRRILSRDFSIVDFNPAVPMEGFFIQED